MIHLEIAYYLVMLLSGVAALAIAALIQKELKSYALLSFLFFYVTFTVTMLLNLVGSYLEGNVPSAANAYHIIKYLENPVSLLILLYASPAMVHAITDDSGSRRKNLAIGLLTIILLLLNYTLSLFGDSSVNSWRIYSKDVIFILVIVYSQWLLIRHFLSIEDPHARRFFFRLVVVFGFLLPGIFSDTFLLEYTLFKFFPILYAATGVIFTNYFYDVLKESRLAAESTVSERTYRGSFPSEALAQSFSMSPREIEVVALLAEGKSYQDIAEALFISVHTVKSHLRKSYQKLGVKNRIELTAMISKLALQVENREGTEKT